MSSPEFTAFKERLASILRNTADGSRYSARSKLNTRPHFVPITLEALNISLAHKIDPNKMSVKELHSLVTKYVIKQHSKHKIFVEAKGWRVARTNKLLTQLNVIENTPALVYQNGVLQGVLYATERDSFGSAGILKEMLNKDPQIMGALLGSKGIHLGHTDIAGIASTPSAARTERILSEISNASPELLERHALALLNMHSEITSAFNNLEVLHAEYGRKIETTFTKEFKAGLVRIKANVVLLQEGEENEEWGRTIEGPVIREVRNIILDYHSSRSLREEVVHQVAQALGGKKIGSTNSTVTADVSFKGKKQGTKLGVSSTPKFKNLQTKRTIGLERLLTLINGHLHDVVAANMGDGNRRDVLNYRTGRLATSTKVERLTATRDGAITAFYSYMKYPYATFSEGGRQQYPRSRDPKLLITKSVREIAAQYVTNQLRAVNV